MKVLIVLNQGLTIDDAFRGWIKFNMVKFKVGINRGMCQH